MKLGQEYISEFSGEDIQPEILAEELGLKEFRFPDEHYQYAEFVAREIITKIIPYLRDLSIEQIGDYLVAHRQEIFGIFDTFPEMHRFPLLVKKDVLVSHGIISAQLLRMNTTDFYNAFLQCMHFYLYLKSVENLSKIYQRYAHIQGISPVIAKLVQDECDNEIKCAWGMRSAYFFDLMVPGKKGTELVQHMLQADEYTIPSSFREEYTSKKVAFWRREGLGPERILLNLEKLVHGKISTDDQHKFAELDVPALNFFLCQNHILGYEEIISKIFRNPDHTLTWAAWIDRYFDVLMKHDSQARKVFYYVFGLEGSLFENGVIPNRLKREKEKIKKGATVKGATVKGLPEVMCSVLEKQYRAYKDKIKKDKIGKKPPGTVAKILTPLPAQTAMAALTTVPALVLKETVDHPSQSQIFGDIDTLRKNKKQLNQLDLTSLSGLPDDTRVELRYTIPGQKSPEIMVCALGKVEMIPVAQGKNIRGKFAYSLMITLPSTHIFELRGSSSIKLEDSWYAEAEWTSEEIIEEEQRLQTQREKPKTPVALFEPIVSGVSTVVATLMPQNPGETAATTWHLLLSETADIAENMTEDGVVNFTLPFVWKEGIEKEYHTISVSGNPEQCRPSLGLDIDSILLQRARKIREAESVRQEREKEQLQLTAFLQKHAYLMQIFEEAAEKMKTEKKAGGIDTMIAELLAKMRVSEWITFSNGQGTQITLRHKGFVQIQLRGSSISILPESSWAMTDIEKTGYHIIAERLRDMLAIINTKKPQERIQLARQMSERREAVVVYQEALRRGQARLIVLPPENEEIGFPKGIYPLVINDISYENIDAKIAELEALYPGCSVECCLIKDAITINGPTSKMSATLLADSARAMYILRKRVLITLKILPDTDDPNRAPIDHPKKRKISRTSEETLVGAPLDPLVFPSEKSPRVILEKRVKESGVETAGAVTDDFLRLYLQALQEKDVLVGYTYPVSMTWKSLVQMTKTTAG